MTLAELNGHLDLVQQLQKTEELLQGLWNAAVPGAQKLDGMPHASGVNDKVGVLGAEIADMETQRDALKEQIARSEETIAVWIAGIEDNTTRLVFRLRFIRGMPWKVVARCAWRAKFRGWCEVHMLSLPRNLPRHDAR